MRSLIRKIKQNRGNYYKKMILVVRMEVPRNFKIHILTIVILWEVLKNKLRSYLILKIILKTIQYLVIKYLAINRNITNKSLE